MADFTGSRVAGVNGTRPENGDAASLKQMVTRIDLSTAPVLNDRALSQPIPKRSLITGVKIISARLDTNATATMTGVVGFIQGGTVSGSYFVNATSDARLIYRTGGTAVANVFADGPLLTTQDTQIVVTFLNAPATFAAGSIWIIVDFISTTS